MKVTPWCLTLCNPMDCGPPGSAAHEILQAGVGSHSLLQGIFLTQWLNSGLLHHRRILYYLSHQGSPVSNGNVLKLTAVMVCETLWMYYNHRTVYTFQRVNLEVYKVYGTWIILLSVTQKILIELYVVKGEYNILKFFFFPQRSNFIILFYFIFISWRLITLQFCSGFCHTLKWISHGFTCVPH